MRKREIRYLCILTDHHKLGLTFLDATYIASTIHLFELVKMGFDGSQILFFHIAEEVLDGQSGHLDGGCGVHDCHSPGHPEQKYSHFQNIDYEQRWSKLI